MKRYIRISLLLTIGLLCFGGCNEGEEFNKLPDGVNGKFITNYGDYELIVRENIFQMYDVSTNNREESGGNLYDFHYKDCENFLVKRRKKVDKEGCNIIIKINYCGPYSSDLIRLCNYNQPKARWDKIIVHEDVGVFEFYRD